MPTKEEIRAANSSDIIDLGRLVIQKTVLRFSLERR